MSATQYTYCPTYSHGHIHGDNEHCNNLNYNKIVKLWNGLPFSPS